MCRSPSAPAWASEKAPSFVLGPSDHFYTKAGGISKKPTSGWPLPLWKPAVAFHFHEPLPWPTRHRLIWPYLLPLPPFAHCTPATAVFPGILDPVWSSPHGYPHTNCLPSSNAFPQHGPLPWLLLTFQTAADVPPPQVYPDLLTWVLSPLCLHYSALSPPVLFFSNMSHHM